MTASPPTSITSSGRPTRRAAQNASAAIASSERNLPGHIMEEDLLKEALAPMKDADSEDHKAWVEMESDPAYFSGVLKDLGVEDVKIQELFAVSMEEVEQLPQPVYGFVFLCRYVGEDQEDTEAAPQDLWFANQTMANGCATVALINIVMNQPTITLGPTLTAFKHTTLPATPLVRGYRLDSHPLIRQTHNAFARRLEHLNADLTQENEFDDEEGDPDAAAFKRNTKKNKQRAAAAAARAQHHTRKALPPPKRKRKSAPDTCHYKAFLPALGQVWVLDGLEANPVSLGPATAAHWHALALEGIQAKMRDAGNLVNVLAVCQAPTRRLRAELAANIVALGRARAALPEDTRPPRGAQMLYYEPDDNPDDERALAPFNITAAQLAASVQQEEQENCEVTIDTVRALEARQMEIIMAYNMEEMGAEGEAARCEERKEDFGAAIHLWVEKLAAMGMLRALVQAE